MNIKASTIFVTFILLFAVAGIIVTLTFPKVEAQVLPMVLLSGIFILAAVQLTKELRSKEKPAVKEAKAAEAEEGEETVEWQWHQLLAPLSWIVGLCVGIYLLGFFFALPIFFVVYLKYRGRSWLRSILFSAIATGIFYLFFQTILSANLWVGLFFR